LYPSGHEAVPSAQISRWQTAVPHDPQFFGSVRVSVHVVPQIVPGHGPVESTIASSGPSLGGGLVSTRVSMSDVSMPGVVSFDGVESTREESPPPVDVSPLPESPSPPPAVSKFDELQATTTVSEIEASREKRSIDRKRTAPARTAKIDDVRAGGSRRSDQMLSAPVRRR
jgi:hypothetical protein